MNNEDLQQVTIQPSDFLKQLKIDVPEPERFIDSLLSFLLWMPSNSTFGTNVFSVTKLDRNTIFMEAEVEPDELVNVLAKTDIRIPI